jgi:putative DNA primase/helicase
MVSLARHETTVAVSHEQLDADRMLLNVPNGTIDLRTGKVRVHRRKDLITKLAPVPFEPAAECPLWLAFLDRVMGGNAELIEYLQRIIGYSLTGEIREHVLAFFYGQGANGKSTFLTAIHEMLGDYASPAPRGLLFRSRGERHPTELASLHGRRFVTCSEVEEGQTFDEALTKDLTGGDPIECRRMREDFWSFQPTHKLTLAGNHKPTVRGDDEGIWRRMRLVPWTVTIPEAERDMRLTEKLRAELPGILAWAVRGCLAWQERGLDAPAAVREATAEYRQENDALGEFFRLSVVFEAGATIARKDLREAYETFCRESGCEPFGAKRFAGRLRERGVGETNVRRGMKFADGWRGARLMTDAERAAAATWSGRGDVGRSGDRKPHSGCIESRGAQTGNCSPQVPTSPQPTDEVTDSDSSFAGWLQTQGIAPPGGTE